MNRKQPQPPSAPVPTSRDMRRDSYRQGKAHVPDPERAERAAADTAARQRGTAQQKKDTD